MISIFLVNFVATLSICASIVSEVEGSNTEIEPDMTPAAAPIASKYGPPANEASPPTSLVKRSKLDGFETAI